MQTNGTMNKPKLELLQGVPTKLTLLKDKPYVSENSYGPFYLYSTKDENGIEYSYFADASIHNLIQQHKLKAGSSFVLQRVATMNGKKSSSKVEFSIIGEPETPQDEAFQDSFCNQMIQSMKDAAKVVASVPELAFRTEDARAIGLSLFIARSK